MQFFAFCPFCGAGLNFNNVISQIPIKGQESLSLYLLCDDCNEQCKTTANSALWQDYSRKFVALQREIGMSVAVFSFDLEDTNTVDEFMRWAGSFEHAPIEGRKPCGCAQCAPKVVRVN